MTALYITELPGPDRRRTRSLYHYRVTFRDPDPKAIGCAMMWEVLGGRSEYQIALERDERGKLHWHCTCADAIYRAEAEGRVCKHVRGLWAFNPASRAA